MRLTTHTKHRIEFFVLKCFECFFCALPLGLSSRIGGFIVGLVGPRLKRHKIAVRQLKAILPNAPASTINLMWKNIGSTAAEFLAIPNKNLADALTVHGRENIPARGKPAIFIAAHLGNWELIPMIAKQNGIDMVVVQRRASNPLSAALIEKKRLNFSHSLAPKNSQGVALLIRAIKEGKSIGMLTDLRISGGIEAEFFGHTAMTSPLPAEIAIKYGVPIILTKIVRRGATKFDTYFYPPLKWDPTGNVKNDIVSITNKINSAFESWIHENPDQWLWFHERWGKGKF